MSATDNTGVPSAELRHPYKQTSTGRAVYWFGVAFALLHIYFNTLSTLPELWTSAIHFGGFAFLIAIMVPVLKSHADKRPNAALLVDIVLGLLALATAGYLILYEDSLYERGVHFVTSDWIAAFCALFLCLEFTRRTAGWFIPVLIVISLSYVFWWGKYITGIFAFPGLELETLLFRSYFSTEGMFGAIARISWSFVFMFILFGAFLVKSGAGEFIIRLAQAVAGRFVGGPGLVAVLGSGLMGSVSGSSVANTVSTGVITIPIMRKAGFPARFAAGVEAAASTGGQLMPPIMGAGAFIMSSYTQISYLEIITYAALPALLYFLSVGFFVRIEAKRSHAIAVEEEALSAKQVIKEGWYCLLPIIVLVIALIYGFTPTYAAGIGILSVIAASWLSSKPMKLKEICDALAQGSVNMATTAMLLIAVGLVVNVVATTGVGNTFSLMITEWAGGSLIITILLVALASLILGMGLPVTASYIVLGTLSAPAIYTLIAESQLLDLMVSGTLPETAKSIFLLADPEKAALLAAPMSMADAESLLALVPIDFKNQLLEMALPAETLSMILLSAHMIIFWLSQDSNVTPPVCLTAFAAAAIAKTPPMITGLYSWKIAKGLYIIPMLFAYTVFIGGPWLEIIKIFTFACFGIYALAGFMEGYLESKLNWFQRIFLLGLGLVLLWPSIPLWVDVVAAVIFIAFFCYTIKRQTNGHATLQSENASA